jgi:hypothetical protein
MAAVAAERNLLFGLLALQNGLITRQGGDAEKRRAAIPAGRCMRESLAKLGDPDIGATLGHARLDRVLGELLI